MEVRGAKVALYRRYPRTQVERNRKVQTHIMQTHHAELQNMQIGLVLMSTPL